MKKILVGLDCEDLVEKIKKTGKYMVYDRTISFQEGVLKYLADNMVDVIITKDSISGSMTKEIYMKQLRLIAPESKIIVFTGSLDETYKGFLFANDIFNVIESDEISFLDVLDMIDNTKGQVVYKNKDISDAKSMNVISKKLIAVFGTSGAGKSYFSSALSQMISKKLKLNTLLLDMDVLNSATDIYNNINTYDNSLLKVMEDIDNDCFDSSSLYDSITRTKKNSNLSYLINNSGIYEAQNRISIEYYLKIYKESIDKFDITVVDLPSTPYIDVVPYTLTRANEIFFVINPNFVSLRQALKYLELMVDVWGVPKNIIHVIVNKKRKSSLDKAQVEMLLRGYNVLMEIEDSEMVEEVVNGVKEIDETNMRGIENVYRLIGADFGPKGIDDATMYNKLGRISELFGVKK